MSRANSAFAVRSLAPGVSLHVQSSTKHKTNRVYLYWVGDLDSDVTLRAMLPAVLQRGTRSFPNMREVTRHLEMLYGASLFGEVMKVGERHVIVFRIEFANDNYLPAGESILKPVLEFLGELLREPHREGDYFPKAVVEQETENHRRFIEGLLNDKRSYAVQRCLEETCGDEPYRLYEYGRVADLEHVNPARLTEVWRKNVEGAPTHIYFSGDLEEEPAAAMLASLVEERFDPPFEIRPLGELKGAGNPREVEEQLDVQQAKLVMSYRTRTRHGDPLLEPLVLANGVLGLFPHSKLFQNVREAASLCYYASSSLERTHGLLFISSGIDTGNREQAQTLIQKQVEDLQQGNISDEELDATRKAFENRLLMLEDSPGTQMDIDLSWRLAGVEYDHDAYRRRLLETSRDRVVEAASRLELDTVYFLHPGKEK
ncbi:MAG: pitrilysin family protein [Planctomycetota bacterium]